jgi:spore germination cell wall hydrolase CwlJ-like protein
MSKDLRFVLVLLFVGVISSACVSAYVLHEQDSEPQMVIAQPIEPIELVEAVSETESAFVYVYEGEVDFSAQSQMSEDELIARVVQAEAGAEPLVGKVAVAATILNRAECRGMTIEEVIYEPNQYAAPTKGIVNNESQEAVRIAREQRDLFPRNMVYFRRDYFHAKYGEPYVIIGHHYFSTEPKHAEGNDEL